MDKSKKIIKGLFETKNNNATDGNIDSGNIEGININGVEVLEGKGDI